MVPLGMSGEALDSGLTYLRRLRIWEFRECLSPGTVQTPRKPKLSEQQWEHVAGLFERDILARRKKLEACPAQFTAKQALVVGAVLLMFDVMGNEAHTSLYEDIQNIVACGLVTLSQQPRGVPSTATIAKTIYALVDCGAIKYMPGWTGVRSTLILDDLSAVDTSAPRSGRRMSAVNYLWKGGRQSGSTTPPTGSQVFSFEPGKSQRQSGSTTPPTGSQVFSFGYVRLLAPLYAGKHGTERAAVTREFTKQLSSRGVSRRKVYETEARMGVNGLYAPFTWVVEIPDEHVAAVELAVQATYRKFQPSA